MRVLIALFWPYGLALEGILPNVVGMARAFSKRQIPVTILAPENHAFFGKCQVITYPPKGMAGFVTTARAFTNLVKQEGVNHDTIVAILRYPTVAYITDGIDPSIHARMVTIFDCPIVDLSFILRAGFSVQSLKCYIGQNVLWTYLARHRSRHYICSTEWQRQQLVTCRFPLDRVSVLPNSICPDSYMLIPRAEARDRFGWDGLRVVGYIGHLSPAKGVDDLLRSAKYWLGKDRRYHLALALSGKGGSEKTVRKWIERSDLRERVTVMGRVNPVEFLAGIDLAVFPFRHEAIMHFPTVLLESAMVSAPVVTTNVGGVSELIQHMETGFTCRPKSPKELGETILRALEDDENRTRCAAQLHSVFRHRLSSDAMVESLISLVG